MDAQLFSSLLKSPYLLKNHSFDELQSLSQLYPFASAIIALIALKAHRENDGSYEHYLNSAAIRVPDRKRLYHLIHAAPVEKMQKVAEQQETITVESIQPPPEITPSPELQTVEPENADKVSVEEAPETKIENETPDQPGVEKNLELPGVGEALEIIKSITEAKVQNEPEPVESKEEPVNEPEPERSHEHSFTGWLSLLKKKKTAISESPVLKEIREISAKSNVDFSKTTKFSEKDEAEISKKAKESLNNDLDWVTETLAKVYELQKKYDKAEEAYRMLSLKYPDKIAYFAQRIENLKKFKV